MYGQKEIISCMMIVGMVAILNYYKSILKRDKEIQNYRRTSIEKQQMDRMLEAERAAFNHAVFMKKLLEYSDRCYDVHALIYRPRDYDNANESEKTIFLELNANATGNDNNDMDGVENGEDMKLDREDKPKNNILLKEKESKRKDKLTEKADTSSVAYVLVAILLGSLIKAALDLTKHYKKKTNNETENDILRRCSLQEYSLLKHKQTKPSKALEAFFKKSISSQRSLDSSSKIALQQQNQLMRRMSGNPQDYSNGSGLISEPGTPGNNIKPGKLLAGRPPPLLRRCSVPIYSSNQTVGQQRRPSIDSYSEDDSGAEINKRRVRMIHRH